MLRGVFIFAGVAALEHWEWLSYLLGAVLCYAAWHTWWNDPAQQKKSAIVEWLSDHFPVNKKAGSGQFLVKSQDGWEATPLLLAVCAIEISDVMFAIDSVPAALSVTRDRFIVYSSNIFAILGLRAIYLALASTIAGLRYLHYGLAAVLAFAGIKIVTARMVRDSAAHLRGGDCFDPGSGDLDEPAREEKAISHPPRLSVRQRKKPSRARNIPR